MALTVYGIPTCGTCKKALAWLDRQGMAYEFVNTKETPPSRDQIAAWVETLGSQPLRNTSGLAYRALGDTKQAWGDPEWIDAFSRDAMLLKRPLFVRDGRAVLVGFRATEAVLQERLGG
jgi:arsenate reductase